MAQNLLVNQLDVPGIMQAAEQTKAMRSENQLYKMKIADAQKPKPVDRADLQRALEWADTPQKFDQAIDIYVAEGHTEFERYRGQFDRRNEFSALLREESAGPLSGPAKVQADIDAGRLPKGTPLRSAGVTVNTGASGIDYGKPPSGMAWARDEQGNVALRTDETTGYASPVAIPVAGGPVETKQEAAAEAEEAKRTREVKQANIVTETIDRAIGLVEGATIPVTGMGSFLSSVPGTKARDVAALVDTIKANAGFDRLQQMRNASPTGGALGQVSEMENRLLQATIGNLEQSQSQAQFLANMRAVKETYLDIIHGPGNRPEAQEGAAKKSPKDMTLEELSALDASTLTEQELQEASARFQELSQ